MHCPLIRQPAKLWRNQLGESDSPQGLQDVLRVMTLVPQGWDMVGYDARVLLYTTKYIHVYTCVRDYIHT